MSGNVFTGNAFSMVGLTQAINKVPYLPARLDALGIFQSEGITTTSVEVEEMEGRLALIPARNRRGPSNRNQALKRKMRMFKVPHLPLDDHIAPEDVQDVKGFGTNELMGQSELIAQRMRQMVANHQATLEYHRIGAVKGVILDADGTSVIYDLFDEFDIDQTEIEFALNDAEAQIGKTCDDVLDAIEGALGAAPYMKVQALCGKTFFQNLTEHPQIAETFKYQQSQMLRADTRFGGFEYKGITFEQYRGKVGDISFVDDDEAHFFPVGAPGLFRRWNAPGNFNGAVNTIGQPLYARIKERENEDGWNLLTEANPLHLCTIPASLIKGTIAA